MKTRVQKFDFAVFIGRFQPIHKGHLRTIKKSLRIAKKLILILGSHSAPRSPRHPWDTAQRKKMISAILPQKQKKKIYFLPIKDFYPQEGVWQKQVEHGVSVLTKQSSSIVLIGHDKDSSSYYLKDFPHWHFKETGNYKNINATDFRKDYFLSDNGKVDYSEIPKKVIPFLKEFQKTEDFKRLKQEYQQS